MSGCLQAAVRQGLDLPPQLPLLVVSRGHIDEEFVLQQHVDVSGLQTTPAARGPARGLAVLWRQVVQHRALVTPPRLQLDREADRITGETCNLNLEEEEGGLIFDQMFFFGGGLFDDILCSLSCFITMISIEKTIKSINFVPFLHLRASLPVLLMHHIFILV